MFRYLLKRILIFIPTLIAISLLAFGLSKIAPGDPLETKDDSRVSVRDRERVYRERAAYWGLDKPVFYFGLSSQAYPDTLYRFVVKQRRDALRNLIAQYGNWQAISDYYHQVESLESFLYNLPDSLPFKNLSIVRSNVRELYIQDRDIQIINSLDTIDQQITQDSILNTFANAHVQALRNSYQRVKTSATPGKLMTPDFKWYGLDNQYHRWFSHFLRGDFGRSYYDNRPVADKLKDALRWTLLMNFIAILIAYALSIPLGVFSAVRKDTVWDRVITVILFVLYSLPTFWIATMLLVFFTTSEYGMDWFPTMGMGDISKDDSFFDIFIIRAQHLILPVFCLTYASLAFISRQMRGGMLDVIQQDYIRTARAKGLSEHKVIWKHAFRNALFPIVTLFASIFPQVLAGSVVIEVIFNIPGMGNLTIDAISRRDWPVVYTVLMLSAILTMAGILIADILYALLDPRVSYNNKK